MLNLSLPGYFPGEEVLIAEAVAATAGEAAFAESALAIGGEAGSGFFSGPAFIGGEAGSGFFAEAFPAYIGGEAGSGFYSGLSGVDSFFSGIGVKDIFTGLQGAGALAGLAGAALQGSMKMPGGAPLPAQKSPAEMPDPESMAVKLKAQREAALRSQKFGRQSTFLTDSDETRLG